MRPLAAYLRGLNPDLPRPVWTLQAGGLVNAVGNGIVLPFLFIYLHNVRGFSLALAGLVLAVLAGVGLALSPVAGALADRFGGRRTLLAALLLLTAGIGALPLVREPWHAFAAAAVAGVGNAGFWPSQASLLAGLTTQANRHSAYAMQRITMNLGVGVGGVVGGLIATTSDPGSFTILFLLDAATFLGYAAVLVAAVPEPELPPHEGAPGTYRDVLRDRPYIAFILLNVVFATAGVAQLVDVLPVFAKNETGVTERQIGFIFFVNTLFIVLTQLPVAKLLEGRRRMRTLAAVAVLWAAAWVLVALTGLALETTAAALALTFAVVVFAVGEVLQGPVVGPLVADLAPPRLRGRYMALSTMSWSAGFALGPALGGALLELDERALWPVVTVALVAAGAGALALERQLPPHVRRTPARAPAALAEAVPAPGVATRPSG